MKSRFLIPALICAAIFGLSLAVTAFGQKPGGQKQNPTQPQRPGQQQDPVRLPHMTEQPQEEMEEEESGERREEEDEATTVRRDRGDREQRNH